jgi:hypothetical protein
MRNKMIVHKTGSSKEIHKVHSINDSIIGLKIVFAYADNCAYQLASKCGLAFGAHPPSVLN